MRLGRQVHNNLKIHLMHQLRNRVCIQYVNALKPVIGCFFNIPHILKVPGVGQLIYVENKVVGVAVHQEPNYMRPNESGTSGNQYAFCIYHIPN
jgi:hypothetical protein